MVDLCYLTQGTGGSSWWSSRIFYDNFKIQNWNSQFRVDTWNNSINCCRDPLVSPTYNSLDNIIVSDGGSLTMRVRPNNNEAGILAYSSSMSSIREDILYGSFRISAKMPNINGSNFGFFFFYSITEEIDIEVLMHENNINRARTAIQPIIRDSGGKASFESQLPIDLETDMYSDYREYRFDWFKDRVEFYIDSVFYHSLSSNIPYHPGKIVVNHRTNGNPKWSRGPPLVDSDVDIRYIDMYFNNTSSELCTDVNVVLPPKVGDLPQPGDLSRYTSSIVVGSVFGFIILATLVIYGYRRLVSKKEETAVEPPMIELNKIPAISEENNSYKLDFNETSNLQTITEHSGEIQEVTMIQNRRP